MSNPHGTPIWYELLTTDAAAWVAYRAMNYPEESPAIFGTFLVLDLLTVPAPISCWRRQSPPGITSFLSRNC